MKPIPALLLLFFLAAGICYMPSCKTIEKGRDGALLGAAAGGSIGALIGKKAGNASIGATIGAALGGSTGEFLSRKLYGSGGNTVKPIYVINGTTYKEKAAQEKLLNISASAIESVRVLNTNEATAIYGDKGENGAILINVKSLVSAGAGDHR